MRDRRRHGPLVFAVHSTCLTILGRGECGDVMASARQGPAIRPRDCCLICPVLVEQVGAFPDRAAVTPRALSLRKQ